MRNRDFRHSNLPMPATRAITLRVAAPNILPILSILVLVIVLIIMGR